MISSDVLNIFEILALEDGSSKQTHCLANNTYALKLTCFDRSFSFFFYPISALLRGVATGGV